MVKGREEPKGGKYEHYEWQEKLKQKKKNKVYEGKTI